MATREEGSADSLALFTRIDSFDPGTRSAEFVCSTEAMDSHGTILRQNWNLEAFEKNPVVLFAHDRYNLPVGKASDVRVDGGKLLARITLLSGKANPACDMIAAQWAEDSLRAVSVGFWPKTRRWETINDVEVLVLDDLDLKEISICPVGSNPEALGRHSEVLTRMRTEAQTSRKEAAKGSPEGQRATGPEGSKDMNPEQEAQARAAQIVREQDLAKRDAEILDLRSAKATLEAEVSKKATDLIAAEKRAVEAETLVVRTLIESKLGKNVDPSEVDHLVDLARVSRPLFDKEMARRESRDDGLTRAEIKPNVDGKVPSTAVNIEAEEAAALARHLEKNQ